MLLALLALANTLRVYAKHGENSSTESSSTRVSRTTSSPSTSTSFTRTSTLSPSFTSSAAPSASPQSVSLTIDTPANVTTCSDTSFSWSAQGVPPGTPLTLQVVWGNRTMRTLGRNVPATARHLDWHTVDIPEGTYTISAFDSNHTMGISAQSSPFVVESGADRSCLAMLTDPISSSAAMISNDGSMNPGLVAALCAVSAAVLLFALAAGAYVFRRYYSRHRLHRGRPGGPRYLF